MVFEYKLAVVAHLSWLAAPRSSSPPSLTRAPPADRLAPMTPHARPLRSSPEQSRTTPLPCTTFPTLGAAIIKRPATKRAPPPVGDSESGQILWSLIDHRSVFPLTALRRPEKSLGVEYSRSYLLVGGTAVHRTYRNANECSTLRGPPRDTGFSSHTSTNNAISILPGLVLRFWPPSPACGLNPDPACDGRLPLLAGCWVLG
jgi:hypothetical protein